MPGHVALPLSFFTSVPLFRAGKMLSGDIFVLTVQKNSNSGNLSKVKLYLTAQIAFSGFVDKDSKMDVVYLESRSEFDTDFQSMTITKLVKDGLCK